jgi:hypothetical protein
MGTRLALIGLCLAILATGVGCGKPAASVPSKVSEVGTTEVTAVLEEVRGEFVNRANYDYAFVIRYKVKTVHRGQVDGDTIYIAHYNPQKTRSAAADVRVTDVGGNVTRFKAGDTHRIALEAPIDDYYMGGIINRYFDEYKGIVYWAVWTDEAE